VVVDAFFLASHKTMSLGEVVQEYSETRTGKTQIGRFASEE
jgi:hypothetical protein